MQNGYLLLPQTRANRAKIIIGTVILSMTFCAVLRFARRGRVVAGCAVRPRDDVRRPPAPRAVRRRRGRTPPAPRAGALFVPLRRARPAHRRREEPARDEDRRHGDRVLHDGRTGRHRPDGQVQGGQAQRVQRRRGPQEARLRRGTTAPASAALLTVPRASRSRFLF